MGLTLGVMALRVHWPKRFKGVFLQLTGWSLVLMRHRLARLMKPPHFPCLWILCSHRSATLIAYWLCVIASKVAGFIASALAYLLLLPERKQGLIRLKW